MQVKTFFRFLVLIICLSSCHSRRSSSKQVFHYNESSNIATLDPAFAKNQSIMWAVHQLYSTLVETSPDLNVTPSLALRWEVSEDRLLYTFYIRQDVYFHMMWNTVSKESSTLPPPAAAPGSLIRGSIRKRVFGPSMTPFLSCACCGRSHRCLDCSACSTARSFRTKW